MSDKPNLEDTYPFPYLMQAGHPPLDTDLGMLQAAYVNDQLKRAEKRAAQEAVVQANALETAQKFKTALVKLGFNCADTAFSEAKYHLGQGFYIVLVSWRDMGLAIRVSKEYYDIGGDEGYPTCILNAPEHEVHVVSFRENQQTELAEIYDLIRRIELRHADRLAKFTTQATPVAINVSEGEPVALINTNSIVEANRLIEKGYEFIQVYYDTQNQETCYIMQYSGFVPLYNLTLNPPPDHTGV